MASVQWISVGTGDDYFMDVSVGEVERQLARLGLHVITAAEKAVLDACADCQLRYLRLHAEDGMGSAWVAGVAEAELARREAAK